MLNKALVLALVTISILYSQLGLTKNLDVLYLTLDSQTEKLSIKARLGNKERSYQVTEAKEVLNRNFIKLWHQLDTFETTQQSVDKVLSPLETQFFKPIEDLMIKAKQIHFVLDDNAFRYAIDLIPFQGKPLFVQYPISFSNTQVVVKQDSYFSKDWTSLSISDHTADPDNAVSFLSQILPRNQHFKMEDINYAKLKATTEKDVLLFSLHGISTNTHAEMDLNDDTLTAQDFFVFNSKLIYLDSCQMGGSSGFLSSLRNYGNEFFIAPFFSNEAGDSSSKTLKGFFENLAKGDAPAIALYKVRKSLFEEYTQAVGIDEAYWKAYPFRVFQQI